MDAQHSYERIEMSEWRDYDRVRIVTLPDGRYAIVKDGQVVEVLP